MIPGEYLLANEPIEINAGRPRRRVHVANTGDRPVQVGSHFHFLEVNRCLVFDRAAAYGMRLNIASGTAVRFEPGDTVEVELVAIGGRREVIGLNRLVDGALDAEAVREATVTGLDRFAPTKSAIALAIGSHSMSGERLRLNCDGPENLGRKDTTS
jgi:urease beta subunit